ncbi:DUF2061 domain-containing protein [Chloroflexota bacterium]
MAIDTHKRSLTKAVIYKTGSIVLLAGASWIITRDLMQMSLITVTYEIIAAIGYYVHERLWEKIRWGRKDTA